MSISKTAEVKARISPEVKDQAGDVLKGWGISFSEAISMYLHKIIEVGGIPFNVRPEEYITPEVKRYLIETAYTPELDKNGIATLPSEWDEEE